MLVPSDRSDPVLRPIVPHGMRWGTTRSSSSVRSPISARSRAAVFNCSPAMPWTGRSTPVEVAIYRRMATFDGYCGDSGDSAQRAARLLRSSTSVHASDAACLPKVLLVNAVGGVSGRGRVTRGIACQLRHRRSIPRCHSVVGGVRSKRGEGHGDAVHAIAQAGRRRPVVEHVAEVTSAPVAENFGTCHSQAGVWAF
jgi:hypothetical protein